MNFLAEVTMSNRIDGRRTTDTRTIRQIETESAQAAERSKAAKEAEETPDKMPGRPVEEWQNKRAADPEMPGRLNPHKVRKGENLETIAINALGKLGQNNPTRRQINKTVDSIAALNKIADKDVIPAGMTLQMPDVYAEVLAKGQKMRLAPGGGGLQPAKDMDKEPKAAEAETSEEASEPQKCEASQTGQTGGNDIPSAYDIAGATVAETADIMGRGANRIGENAKEYGRDVARTWSSVQDFAQGVEKAGEDYEKGVQDSGKEFLKKLIPGW